jgi:ATP-dependent RNA helicase RhlE
LQAIPIILAGRDLLGAAQTGTGKTAGFALPLLQRLAPFASKSTSPALHPVRCLVLTPTRELAIQVHESVQTYGKHVALRAACIYGGVNINPQIAELKRGVEIVVATPGRLLDHVGQRTIDLRHVQILVLDEADRMLDMGFIHDIKRILALLPKQRQSLLFSATFSEEIRTLSKQFLNDPTTVEVARRNTPAELVTQIAHPVDSARKRELLSYLVKTNNWYQVLVFCKTKHGANRLAQQLVRDGIEADAIHGNKSQNARSRALEMFKDNKLQVLVATDIAARGLDIESLPHVVNFDMPHVPEDYVHRIGRTGRAGAEGEAISLVSPEDRPLLAAIERMMKREVELKVVEGFEYNKATSTRTAESIRDERPSRGSSRGSSRGGERHSRSGGRGEPARQRSAPQPQPPRQAEERRPVQRQPEERPPVKVESRPAERDTREPRRDPRSQVDTQAQQPDQPIVRRQAVKQTPVLFSKNRKAA